MPETDSKNFLSQEAKHALSEYRVAERAAFAVGDGAIADRFAEDIILISNGAPTIQGRAATRNHFENLWQTHSTIFGELVDEDVVEIGDLLIASGRFDLNVSEKPNGAATTTKGRFLAIFRKGSDGQYKLWREAALDGGSAETP